MLCREQAAQLSAIESEITALGARLVFVGNGTPEHARDFRSTQGITAPLYVSPDLGAYRAFGFKSGLASTIGPAAVAHGVRALLGGHRQGAITGAPMQQGGVVLMMPDGTTPYVYRSGAAGDHPTTADLLAAIRAATAA